MGRPGLRRDDLLARGKAVQAGEHQVHEHQVDVARERGLETGAAVVLLQHLVARPPQVVGHQIGDGGIVFHQQDALLFRSRPSVLRAALARLDRGGPHN